MNRPVHPSKPEPLKPDDHIIGPDSAPVTVVAYCDFECPFCGAAFVRMKRLRERFGHQFRLVYRHFPLVDKHPFAQQAAEASEAAAMQGRFWELHDLLFDHQEHLETDDLYRYAEAAGLDLPRFKAELHGRVYASRVLADARSGRRSGVTGTPTFFFNDAWLEDDNRLEDMVGQAA
jgi:protein-disulfide isomerase